MTDFSQLKANRQDELKKIQEELQKLNKPQRRNEEDEGLYWYPQVGKDGNGQAVVRFLPAPGSEPLPYVKVFNNSFQGPTGQWYIENNPSTIGLPDPVYEYTQKLWASGLESDKDLARKYKRNTTYISNVYVLKDPLNPENEGKIFLFKYGKKIFDKINDLMNPVTDEMDPENTPEPVNPFCLWSGANFKFNIVTIGGFRNYDKSAFSKPAPLFDDDSKLEEVWKNEHSLQQFLTPDKFKEFDVLKKKFAKVIGIDTGGTISKADKHIQREIEHEVPFDPDADDGEGDLEKLFEELNKED